MEYQEKYMQRAIELAKKGIGKVNPNPLVGAVIVKNNQIIGEGYHQCFGEAHAEINAFQSATESVKGATMYVTLEPCSHYGKTPPCAEAIIKHQIAKVFVGMIDPNPLVAKKGIALLQQNGVEVEYGFFEKELQHLNRIFLKYIQQKTPYVVLKTAMTLDGKIATKTGDSRWVTNEKSRTRVHELRNQLMAIMVGVNTIIADNPMLTCRLNQANTKNPIRIVVDSTARIPLNSKILNTPDQAKTIVAVTSKADKEKIAAIENLGNEVIVAATKRRKVDLEDLMLQLGKKGIDSILLEGGASLNNSALRNGVVDEVMAFIAPKIICGATAKTPVGGCGIKKMDDAIQLHNIRIEQFDNDILINGEVDKNVSPKLEDESGDHTQITNY